MNLGEYEAIRQKHRHSINYPVCSYMSIGSTQLKNCVIGEHRNICKMTTKKLITNILKGFTSVILFFSISYYHISYQSKIKN